MSLLASFRKTLSALVLTLAPLACTSAPSPPRQPPGRPPTPASVTRNEPGGDADDPHRAALERMLQGTWGSRNDRDDQVVVPLVDAPNWRRIRYWGFDHLAGFRYGKAYHAVGAAVVQDLPDGVPMKSENCMARFEAWARPHIEGLDVRLGPFGTKLLRWRDQPLVVQTVDGFVSWGLSSTDFSAAWAAYPAYKNACLIYAIAVPWRDSKELALKVRDRFASEGFASLQALTEEKAYRHERKPADGDARPGGEAPSEAQSKFLEMLTGKRKKER